jgi:hypothetical protein
VIENVTRKKKIEEYKAAHGGREPPDPFMTVLGKQLCPCFYRQKKSDHLKMSASMAAKQRMDDDKMKGVDDDEDEDDN